MVIDYALLINDAERLHDALLNLRKKGIPEFGDKDMGGYHALCDSLAERYYPIISGDHAVLEIFLEAVYRTTEIFQDEYAEKIRNLGVVLEELKDGLPSRIEKESIPAPKRGVIIPSSLFDTDSAGPKDNGGRHKLQHLPLF